MVKVFPCEFCKIFEKTFSYRTPLDGCFCNIRSLANWNCMYSSIPLLLVGNNSMMDELRCLTSIVLYLHSEFYGKHCCFESAELPQKDSFKTSSLFRSKEDCSCHREERNHYWFFFMKSQDMLMTSIDETVIFFSLIGIYISF